MKDDRSRKEQIRSIQSETMNSAILNDVVNNEFEQYPGQNEQLVESDSLSAFEREIVAHTVDGKTWNSIKGNRQ
ncbi:hypothetical protein LGQ02_15740 [Bacillus shivajii]|uniref:hypothetical protein n=1 Tax=Bacillus shivajii TaxID=1983719 RepID=UPI001CFBEC2D|nr:hypothetical protein [Bacillus shivajii]UCZ52282.1 hypothetical protein LGQ02_15740 [Bacillus shivajii]